MNIAEKTQELIPILRKEGVNGLLFPEVKRACVDDWSENYASLGNVFFYPPLYDESEYLSFNEVKVWYDLQQMLAAHYPGAAVLEWNDDTVDTIPAGTVVVTVNQRSQEIEIYRKSQV